MAVFYCFLFLRTFGGFLLVWFQSSKLAKRHRSRRTREMLRGVSLSEAEQVLDPLRPRKEGHPVEGVPGFGGEENDQVSFP